MEGMRVVGDGGGCRPLGLVRGAAAVLLLLCAVWVFAGVSVASASSGIFAGFAQCPTGKPDVALCLYGELTGGVFSVGKVSIPVSRTIVLRAGAVHTGGPNPNEYFLVSPVGGEMLSAAEQEIPGGLQAILGCTGCRPLGGAASNTVIATVESAATGADPGVFDLAAAFLEERPALVFPVRVHLHNLLLGRECYVGSSARPIELRLTDGRTSPPPPNRPIAGRLGVLTEQYEHGYAMVTGTGMTLVDNAFSVPTAEGCGEHLAGLYDPIIDRAIGLESRPGNNTAILTATLDLATREAVLANQGASGG